MKTAIPTAAMVTLVLATPLLGQDSATTVAVERGRRLLQAHLDVLDVPAMQVAVARGDEFLWSEAFGQADLEDGTPATPFTRFPIASVSKTLTAVAAAMLAEEGALDLDAPVRTYVESFPEKRWPVTSRQLAHHTAGVRHYHDAAEPTEAGRKHYRDVIDALEIFAGDTLLFRPGSDVRYSSFGFNLLSAVVQAAAGMPFNEFVARRILEPADMRSTSPAYTDSLIPYRAETYVEGEGGGRLRAPVVDPSYKWGSGGYMSTAEDLVRLGQALLRGDLVGPETLERMWTQNEADRGFGWQILESAGDLRVAYHGGNLPDARAHLLIVPSEGLVMALLASTGQRIGFNDEEVLQLMELFLPAGPAPAVDPTGRYLFRSTYSGEPATGWLEIRSRGDDYTATLSFPSGSSSAPVVDVQGHTVHLIVMWGSWMHLWLEFGEEDIHGRWMFYSEGAPITEVRRVETIF